MNNELLHDARQKYGWLIVFLPLALVLFLFIIPFFHGLIISFTDLSVYTFSNGPATFIGFNNYQGLFKDAAFLEVLRNTFLSPSLLIRIFLLAALPLSLALLLRALRPGAQIAVQTLLLPVIFFSGAVATSGFYSIYILPQRGLAMNLLHGQKDLWNSFFTGELLQLLGNVYNILLANGLAYALPIGLALYAAANRGTGAMLLDTQQQFRDFWCRSVRLIVSFGICMIGFSLTGLEGAATFNSNAYHFEIDIITYFYRSSFPYMKWGQGTAAIYILILPLLILGLGLILFLERKDAPISIRFFPKIPGKSAGRQTWSKGCMAVTLIAGLPVLVLIFVLITVFVLPWLGSIPGMAPQETWTLGTFGPAFFAVLCKSLAIALSTAVLCHLISAVAGFVLGYMRPKGARLITALHGAFIFISPVLLLVPYYFFFKELRLLGSAVAIIVPCLLSPLGVIISTWFFRGVRDEFDAEKAQGLNLKRRVLPKRTVKVFIKFSLPVLAFYILSALNQIHLPSIMMNTDFPSTLTSLLYQNTLSSRTMVIFDVNEINESGNMMTLLSLLQYLIPLVLLIISAIMVFPRLALIVRRKGEEPPVPEPVVIEKPKAEK